MLTFLITKDYFKIGVITGAVGLAQAIGGVLYAPIIDKVNHVQMIY